jgi:dTDP-6-deoxy-L-talose 4-dehydrogenase [NAD(P)+]
VVDRGPPTLHGVRVLVTGASGFIGRWVLVTLRSRHAEIGVAARDPGRLPRLDGVARVFPVDCARPGELADVVAQWQPTVLFQLAGYGVAKHERDAEQMQRLNGDLLVEVVEALASCSRPVWPGLRLVHTGSAFEYGSLPMPLDEAVTTAPTTAYGKSKLFGTEVVREAAKARALPALVARLFTVFGPGERSGRLFPTLLAARADAAPVALSSGEQRRDFTLVADVAEALVDLALVPGDDVVLGVGPFDQGVINFASGRLHSVRSFVVAAARALGIAPERLEFGKVPQLAEEMPHLPVPTARMQRALGRALPGDLPDLMARVRARLDAGLTD